MGILPRKALFQKSERRARLDSDIQSLDFKVRRYSEVVL